MEITTEEFLEIAEAILRQPTAPFHEEAVRAEIARLLQPCRNVRLEEDRFGNLIATYQRGKKPASLAFAAHMDHPAYVGREFLGGVPKAYLKKNPPTEKFGKFRMWDLPAFQLKNGRIYSRACDDLIGCACIVAMLRALDRTRRAGAAIGLFTRAEEVGFVGAMQLAKSGRLSKDVTVVSLETSSVKGGPVEFGKGPIIRVGDRTSIFDASATARLQDAAAANEIPVQRALMQGGTCEATAYALYGYRTAALCVALGNYHNCGPNEKIAPEFVSVDDAVGMARLCAAAVGTKATDPLKALRLRLEKRMRTYRAHF
jgi:putative aminopeptidase FrvX